MKQRVDRKFRKLNRIERVNALFSSGYITLEEKEAWIEEAHLLDLESANHMIENVIGRFGFPQGVAINFPLNGKSIVVPMVVEEPSVVAALSYAGLLAEKSGGFTAQSSDPILIGQVQLVNIDDVQQAQTNISHASSELIEHANRLMPNMVKRGGGVRRITSRIIESPSSGQSMLVVHIYVDTRDAMGANLVNQLCEDIAPKLEALTSANALLKILSNFADQSITKAHVTFSTHQLAVGKFSGEEVRDRIILANDLALADPYRATTHNKGIMNGIDAVAIATGNDWRSIEAAVHAYASREGQYKGLTQWYANADGDLRGEIELPLKVGIVGGSLQTNPTVKLNQKLLGIASAKDLTEIMAAVGLAQNFAAIRALSTVGIQQGHMTLHARSVALAAKTPEKYFDQVVQQMVSENNIKIWRATEILEQLTGKE